ncbi:MAG: hypothetical protein GF329_18455 [Candidatus Lokiarchaeota archaeon]|nr:hypothetical protein [Candidatus Lokiarchaeota archaeon]
MKFQTMRNNLPSNEMLMNNKYTENPKYNIESIKVKLNYYIDMVRGEIHSLIIDNVKNSFLEHSKCIKKTFFLKEKIYSKCAFEPHTTLPMRICSNSLGLNTPLKNNSKV